MFSLLLPALAVAAFSLVLFVSVHHTRCKNNKIHSKPFYHKPNCGICWIRPSLSPVFVFICEWEGKGGGLKGAEKTHKKSEIKISIR